MIGVEPQFPPRDMVGLTYWLNRLGGFFTFAELLLLVLVIALALLAPRAGSRVYDRIERALAPIANHPARQIWTIGLLAVLARAAVLPWLGQPVPAVHDEMSIVLQAQTFVAGHLANPTHPFWEHFETIYVNQLPAYASMYFPGRGAPLAAGLLLANNVWLGVWLTVVLMCMACVWMLQGWVSLPLAFLGGLITVVRLSVFSSLINSYLGGAFAVLGGMLVVGALPRLLREPRWRDGIFMALGAGILMLARPYEGALLCLPVALALLARLVRPAWRAGRGAFVKVALPSVVILGAGAAFMLAYNGATTGHALKTPYDLHRVTYANVPAFLTSAPIVSQQRGPAYLREFYAVEGEKYERRGNLVKTGLGVIAKLFYSWNFYVGLTFAAAFFAGMWASRRDYFVLGTLAFFYLGYSIETWNFPQYTAPIFPLLLVVVMRGFEWLRPQRWRGRPTGLFLVRAMPTAAVVLLALPLGAVMFGVPAIPNTTTQACCNIKFDPLRPALVKQFLASPGKDLVLVKDGPNNPVHYELVNNEPDIENAQVVWAHSLGAEKDAALMRHFADRRVWEFEWAWRVREEENQGTAENYRMKEITR